MGGGRPSGGYAPRYRFTAPFRPRYLYQYKYVVRALLAVATSIRRSSRRSYHRWAPALDRAPAAIPPFRTLNWNFPIRPQTTIPHPSQALYRAMLIQSARWKFPRNGLYANAARRRCVFGALGMRRDLRRLRVCNTGRLRIYWANFAP